MRLIQIVCFLSTLAISVTFANAGTITLTGQDLFNSSISTFPTRTPVINGTEINFGYGIDQFEILIDYTWASANTVVAGDTLSVSISMRRILFDFDPPFMISDGTNALGVFASNNDGGTAWAATSLNHSSAVVAPFTILPGPIISSPAGYPSIGDLVTFNLDFVLNASTTDVSLSFLDGSGSRAINTALDLSQPLHFLIVGDNNDEKYGISEITFSSESTAVPEPSTYALVLAGLLCIGIIRQTNRVSTNP